MKVAATDHFSTAWLVFSGLIICTVLVWFFSNLVFPVYLLGL